MSYWEIKFTCAECKKMFVALASVKPSENHFVTGLLCDKCASQTKLTNELDFQV